MNAPEAEFRAGDRVTLIDLPPGYPSDAFNITPGMTGKVEIVDSLATIHVKWDGGQRFGIIASARHLLRLEGEQR